MRNASVSVSIIIPVWGEQSVINHTIAAVRALAGGSEAEIIVVDGCEAGDTLAVIRDAAVRKLISKKGRGRQMNRGAASATGGALLFLHADTVLPSAALARIGEALGHGGCVGGAFDLRIDSPRRLFRIIERVGSLRSRLTRIPYGDQALFVRADYFRALGGFRESPLMEDVEFMSRIKRDGGRIVIFPEPATTSARRWEKAGPVFGTLRNWLLMLLYLCGFPPERLARFYR